MFMTLPVAIDMISDIKLLLERCSFSDMADAERKINRIKLTPVFAVSQDALEISRLIREADAQLADVRKRAEVFLRHDTNYETTNRIVEGELGIAMVVLNQCIEDPSDPSECAAIRVDRDRAIMMLSRSQCVDGITVMMDGYGQLDQADILDYLEGFEDVDPSRVEEHLLYMEANCFSLRMEVERWREGGKTADLLVRNLDDLACSMQALEDIGGDPSPEAIQMMGVLMEHAHELANQEPEFFRSWVRRAKPGPGFGWGTFVPYVIALVLDT